MVRLNGIGGEIYWIHSFAKKCSCGRLLYVLGVLHLASSLRLDSSDRAGRLNNDQPVLARAGL